MAKCEYCGSTLNEVVFKSSDDKTVKFWKCTGSKCGKSTNVVPGMQEAAGGSASPQAEPDQDVQEVIREVDTSSS